MADKEVKRETSEELFKRGFVRCGGCCDGIVHYDKNGYGSIYENGYWREEPPLCMGCHYEKGRCC